MLAWLLAAQTFAIPPTIGEEERWRATIDRVSRAVVTIRMDRPRAFEGTSRTNSQATGFVIDRERGLILTNRHVVTAGPIVARAVFTDQEEVDLVAVYRDPVHDFGIFRYDPSALRHTETVALPLRPDLAEVGVQIRVIGNDSGEQLSILDATLARLERPAPHYGGSYSDYDTFYIQASSSTSGGSSGSPVVDINGNVLAINAGGKSTAATSFYLPLDRVVHAVQRISAGELVPRGTMQTRAEHTPFSEARRLGLTEETEAAARAARSPCTGMLVIRDVLPGGPADGKLEPGDILVELAGKLVLDFVTLEVSLDENIDKTLAAVVERRGKRVETEITIGDLSALVPSRLLEVGAATAHALSIHQALSASVPVRGVYLADAGRMFSELGDGAVIIEADGRTIETLQDLEVVLAEKVDLEPVHVRWFTASRPQQVSESAVLMDRRWFAVRTCARDDTTGRWPCTALPTPEHSEPVRSAALDVSFPPSDTRRVRRVQPSLVGIRTDVPIPAAGLSKTAYSGNGIVVDAERGLVIVDRNAVPIALGEVRVSIAGAFELPAQIVALHEVHNLALVSYDPEAAATVPLQSIRFARRPLGSGDRALYVGIKSDASIETKRVRVNRLEPFGLPSSNTPRFRETNLDVIDLRDPLPSLNGAIVGRTGKLRALWAAFSYTDGQQSKVAWRAIPADVVSEMASGMTQIRTIGWELGVLALPRAAERGLPAAIAEKLIAHDPERRYVLQIERIEEGDPIETQLRTGDLLVAIDGEPVTRFREVEERLINKNRVEVTVVREGGLVTAEILPRALAISDLEQVIIWSGLRLHSPDHSARLLGVPPHRPYISWLESGSPAGRAGIRAQRSVIAVDGEETPDLATFVRQVLAIPPGESVRLDVVTRTGERQVSSIEPDDAFFPTESYTFVGGQWERAVLSR